jgi:hypothetical protein
VIAMTDTRDQLHEITDRLAREIARKSDLNADKALMRDALTEITRLRSKASDMLAALRLAHNDYTLNDSVARAVEDAIAKAEIAS